MKKAISRAALAVVITLVAGISFSCASAQFVQTDKDILKLTALVDSGNYKKLAELSVVPFLFDGEIVLIQGDVQKMWKNIADAGFTLPGAEVESIEAAGPESYTLFGETMDCSTYFDKYFPETGKIARLKTDRGSVIFLVNGKKEGLPQIYGLKVN